MHALDRSDESIPPLGAACQQGGERAAVSLEQLTDCGLDVAGLDRRKIRQRGICEQGIRHRAHPAWVEERLF